MQIITSEAVTAELRAEMGRQRIKHGALAAELGVSPTWLSRRLRNRTPLTVDDLRRIAEGLDLQPLLILSTPERTPQITAALASVA